jgi:hypothetical protein
MRTASTFAALAATLLLAAPAGAQAPEPLPSPTFFFSCVNDTKVQNRENALAWSETAPTTSYTAGGGCGSADPGPWSGRLAGTKVDGFFGGTYGGRIQAINIELHTLLLPRARVPADIGVSLQLRVDGEDILGGPRTFRMAGEPSESGLTDRYRLSITNLDIPEGAPDRPIEIQFSSQFLDYQHAWVWGATEVPGHVQMNPARPWAPRVRA